jgi:hypothetical protein
MEAAEQMLVEMVGVELTAEQKAAEVAEQSDNELFW